MIDIFDLKKDFVLVEIDFLIVYFIMLGYVLYCFKNGLLYI